MSRWPWRSTSTSFHRHLPCRAVIWFWLCSSSHVTSPKTNWNPIISKISFPIMEYNTVFRASEMNRNTFVSDNFGNFYAQCHDMNAHLIWFSVTMHHNAYLQRLMLLSCTQDVEQLSLPLGNHCNAKNGRVLNPSIPFKHILFPCSDAISMLRHRYISYFRHRQFSMSMVVSDGLAPGSLLWIVMTISRLCIVDTLRSVLGD